MSSTAVAFRSPALFTLRDYWIAASVGCMASAVVLALLGLPFISSLLALALLAICAFPTIRYAIKRERIVPAAPILAAAYAIQFAIPVFFSDGTLWLVGGYYTVSRESIDAALLMALGSLLAFLGVYYSKAVWKAAKKLPSVRLHLNRLRALMFCATFSAISIGSSQYFSELPIDTQVEYSGIFHILQNQLLISIGILGWLTYTSRSALLRGLYYLLIAAAVMQGMSTGFLESTLAPIGIMFALEWIYRRRVNKTLIALLIGTLLLLNPVKTEYRDAVWYSSDTSDVQSPLDKAMLWAGSGVDYWRDVFIGRSSGNQAAEQLIRRTSMIDTLAHVYEMTPDVVPYYLGQTYSYFLYSFIPRLVWPEKPVTSANRTFAVDYQLTTDEGAMRSTFGISLLGEGYANFGWPGPILVMTVVAFILVALQCMFATEASGPGGYAIFCAFFIFFLNGLGSSAEILLGNILQGMIASWMLLYWAVDHRPRNTRTP